MRTFGFKELRAHLRRALQDPLPGAEGQDPMAPIGRARTDINQIKEEQVKKAAVLALIIEHREMPHLVLTLRTQYPGVHSGQISFPGGRREPEDGSFEETALRETREETGLHAENIRVIGKLSPLYVPPSNFLVHPYVGLYDGRPSFQKQDSEVQQIITIDFNRVLQESAVQEENVTARGLSLKVPAFNIDGHIIWGATAMMLSELRQIALQ